MTSEQRAHDLAIVITERMIVLPRINGCDNADIGELKQRATEYYIEAYSHALGRLTEIK